MHLLIAVIYIPQLIKYLSEFIALLWTQLNLNPIPTGKSAVYTTIRGQVGPLILTLGLRTGRQLPEIRNPNSTSPQGEKIAAGTNTTIVKFSTYPLSNHRKNNARDYLPSSEW